MKNLRNYLLIGIIAITALFLLDSCSKFKKTVELIDFELTQNNETAPATIRINYLIEVQNNCVDYSISYVGADSTRTVFYDENNPNAIDQIKFSENSGNIYNGNICVQGDALVFKHILDLQYLNAGDYEISITLNDETQTKSFKLLPAEQS